MRIAISCRPLAGARFRPEFLHLGDLIDVWRTAGDEVILIRPPGASDDLAGGVRGVCNESERSVWKRANSLVWGEAQSAAEAGAEVLFIPEPIAPLIAQLPIVAMLGRRTARPTSFLERVRVAAGRAGLRGASALLTLDDLPPIVPAMRSVRSLPAFVGPAFSPLPVKADGDHLRALGLTPGYCLAFGGSEAELRVLLAAWSWVAGALGDEYPLAIVGGGEVLAERVHTLAVAADVVESVRWLEGIPAEALPALFRGADAFLHAGRTSIGQELRWALACGVPIAGVETPETTAVLGEAGYLVPAFDTRALGGACLTAIVETDVAEKLRQRGLARAGVYHEPSSRQAWAEVFRSISPSGDHRRLR